MFNKKWYLLTVKCNIAVRSCEDFIGFFSILSLKITSVNICYCWFLWNDIVVIMAWTWNFNTMFLGTGKRFGLVFRFIAIPVSKQGSNVPKILCSYQCTHHLLLAHLAKDQVSLCHYSTSCVSSFKSSLQNPLNQIQSNLAGMIPFQKLCPLAKNRNFWNSLLLLDCKSKWAQNWLPLLQVEFH
jgi:hypothetical protein